MGLLPLFSSGVLGEFHCWQGAIACIPPNTCSPDPPRSSLKNVTCSVEAVNSTEMCFRSMGYVNSSLEWIFGCARSETKETGCFDLTVVDAWYSGEYCHCDTPLCNDPDADLNKPPNPMPTKPSNSAPTSASTIAILFGVFLFILS